MNVSANLSSGGVADPPTKAGAVVRRFWQHYFDASGATFRPKKPHDLRAHATEAIEVVAAMGYTATDLWAVNGM